MRTLQGPDVSVSENLLAGLLLVARDVLRECGLGWPAVEEVLQVTGAHRSRAYELRDAIWELVPNLQRLPGRPADPPPLPAVPSEEVWLSREVLRFLMAHPGAACAGNSRRSYSDDFRHFILDLRDRHPQPELEAFAQAVCVPLGTLKAWQQPAAAPSPQATSPQASPPADEAQNAQIQTVLAAWERWKGPFIAFCDHVQQHLRIPWGRTYLADLLRAYGARIPKRRPGRSPDELALRDAFATFFPGAQWGADGSALEVELNGERFRFNLELLVDTETAAAVGASLGETEDSQAVTAGFRDGVAQTGAPPLALLLDNRPSNHTEEVDQALGDTLRIRTTPFRSQNNAHIEGTFGLLKQVAPPLRVEGSTPSQLAQSILRLVIQTWGRTLNHRPRHDRGGHSRAQLYQAAAPSPEQVAQARAALEERRRQQDLARQTRLARLDPIVRDTLDTAFARLALLDPESHLRAAIARYPLDAILAGIATFKGKQETGRLPPGVDARYLLGIVRNLSEEQEGRAISQALLEARLQAQDRMLQGLQRERDDLARLPMAADPIGHLAELVRRALDTDRHLDRCFWLRAAAEVIRAMPPDRHEELLRRTLCRVHSTHRIPHRQRLSITHSLAEQVIRLT